MKEITGRFLYILLFILIAPLMLMRAFLEGLKGAFKSIISCYMYEFRDIPKMVYMVIFKWEENVGAITIERFKKLLKQISKRGNK